MSKSPSLRRIQADIRELALDPSDRYHAAPMENDMFEWHFTIRGADATDFEGGTYHGRILLPPDYPYKPPHIMFLTPSGRFETNTKICLSFSAYHPELWQPAWGIRLILEALISFLPTPTDGAIGALDWSSAERKKLALKSRSYSCPCCGPIVSLLPKLGSTNNGSNANKSSRFQKEIEQLQLLQQQEHKKVEEGKAVTYNDTVVAVAAKNHEDESHKAGDDHSNEGLAATEAKSSAGDRAGPVGGDDATAAFAPTASSPADEDHRKGNESSSSQKPSALSPSSTQALSPESTRIDHRSDRGAGETQTSDSATPAEAATASASAAVASSTSEPATAAGAAATTGQAARAAAAAPTAAAAEAADDATTGWYDPMLQVGIVLVSFIVNLLATKVEAAWEELEQLNRQLDDGSGGV